jgi:hypothetical protein
MMRTAVVLLGFGFQTVGGLLLFMNVREAAGFAFIFGGILLALAQVAG